MDAKETIPPMTGQKVYYNIGHDDLVSFADRIIRKEKEEERKHQQEAADSTNSFLMIGNYRFCRYSVGVMPNWRLNWSRKVAGVKPTFSAISLSDISGSSRSKRTASSSRIELI